MAQISVNFDEIREKPDMEAGKAYKFAIKAMPEVRQGKTPNKTTGQLTTYINSAIEATDPADPQNVYTVYNSWFLTPNALSSADPAISLRKFLIVTGKGWTPGQAGFDPADLYGMEFEGTINYQKGDRFPKLATIVPTS